MLLGHTCVCAVEIESYPRGILLQRQRDGILPKFPIWDDVQTFDGKPWRGKVEIVCGGFPCQDISSANRNTIGIDGKRSGLWREMARIVGEVCPKTLTTSDIARGASNSELKISAKQFGRGFGYWGVVPASPITHSMSASAILNTKYGTTISSAHRRFLESFGHLPPAGVCGMGDGVPHRVDRFTAIGNAQNPVVAALAFTILKGSFDSPKIERTDFAEAFRNAA